jgi:hypothetical protein
VSLSSGGAAGVARTGSTSVSFPPNCNARRRNGSLTSTLAVRFAQIADIALRGFGAGLDGACRVSRMHARRSPF